MPHPHFLMCVFSFLWTDLLACCSSVGEYSETDVGNWYTFWTATIFSGRISKLSGSDSMLGERSEQEDLRNSSISASCRSSSVGDASSIGERLLGGVLGLSLLLCARISSLSFFDFFPVPFCFSCSLRSSSSSLSSSSSDESSMVGSIWPGCRCFAFLCCLPSPLDRTWLGCCCHCLHQEKTKMLEYVPGVKLDACKLEEPSPLDLSSGESVRLSSSPSSDVWRTVAVLLSSIVLKMSYTSSTVYWRLFSFS